MRTEETFPDGQHTVFGQVGEGWETVDKLNDAICDESHTPYRDIRISHTIILDDPFPDPKGLQIPTRSPSPDPAILKVRYNIKMSSTSPTSRRRKLPPPFIPSDPFLIFHYILQLLSLVTNVPTHHVVIDVFLNANNSKYRFERVEFQKK